MNDEMITLFEMYLLTERRAPRNTTYAYVHDVKGYATFLERQQSSLYASQLKDAKAYLQQLKGNGISARSLGRKVSSLKVFFTWAQEKHQWYNYTSDLVFPKIPKRLPTYLTPEEVDKLLAASSEDASDTGVRNKTILYMLYVSGMRISELTALKRSNIHGTEYITVEGKGGKQRIIPLPAMMFQLLETYLSDVHKRFTQLHGDTDYLFPTVYSGRIKPISRQACWILLQGLCKKSSLGRLISPHKLRHSLATHLLHNGADLRSLQLLLGHENISTVEIYTHLDTRYVRSIYDKKHPRS